MSLLSSSYVAQALDKRQTRESKFLRMHLLNKCWQASSGKIKLYINEYRFKEPFKNTDLRSRSKPRTNSIII